MGQKSNNFEKHHDELIFANQIIQVIYFFY